MKGIYVIAVILLLGWNNSPNQMIGHRPGSIGIIGDTADVQTPVKGGVALIGGGGSVNGAFKWMLERSGGGNVVVLTASGNSDYNADIHALGKVSSVETLNITTRELADNDTVASIIRNAEMLFIAGGDQSRYMYQWKGTKTNQAINYLLQVKKAPVGGTSAGCAILSGIYYSGEGGSAVSNEVLANPYDSLVTLYNNDFLKAPYLRQVISDQHYLARKREGRHVTFMSRIIKDWHIFPRGIAVDERTAVCINERGEAKVFGESKAYFITTEKGKGPERCVKGQPLQWRSREHALKVYEIPATATGNGSFQVAMFDTAGASGGTWYNWWVEDGQLRKKEITHSNQ